MIDQVLGVVGLAALVVAAVALFVGVSVFIEAVFSTKKTVDHIEKLLMDAERDKQE